MNGEIKKKDQWNLKLKAETTNNMALLQMPLNRQFHETYFRMTRNVLAKDQKL